MGSDPTSLTNVLDVSDPISAGAMGRLAHPEICNRRHQRKPLLPQPGTVGTYGVILLDCEANVARDVLLELTCQKREAGGGMMKVGL